MNWNNSAERGRFVTNFRGLCETFGKIPSDALPQIYHRALQDLTIDEFEYAVGQAVMTLKFFPKPIELRELARGRVEDIAEVKAGLVLDAVRMVGAYRSVVIDDPVAQAVIETGFGGWVQMCSEISVETEKWFCKDFTRMYQAYARQGVERYGTLAGVNAIANGAGAFAYEEKPVLVGDPAKARQVQALGPGNEAPALETAQHVSKGAARVLDFAKANTRRVS